MFGGTGNDVYFVDDPGDTTTEASSTGIDTVYTSVSYTLGENLEDLYLQGTAVTGVGNELSNRIVGTSGANRLTGNSGNDRLEGGGGIDTLVGGAGNDTYVTDGYDVLVELSGGGLDTVRSSVSYTLRSNVEHLYLTGSALKGTGNSLANKITGNAYANTLSGGSGNDYLDGGKGSDILLGGAGSDQILGRDGNDVITGGRGADVFTGGRGRDRFVFDDFDTGATPRTADYIPDFRGSLGDRIDLKLIDANVKASGDQAFSFIGTKEFTAAGQVRYEKIGAFTLVLFNTDADLTPEGGIWLKGAMNLSKGWFIL
jgi:Ca2+-binding RTX toxin-like protein